MPTRLSKKKLDEAESLNSIAANIMSKATGQELPKPEPPPIKEKNPAAVALGLLGASKGGKARAENLSNMRRRAIAKQAALARWKKHS